MIRKLLLRAYAAHHHRRCIQTAIVRLSELELKTPIITIPFKSNRLYLKKRFDKKRLLAKGKLVVLAKPGKKLITCSEHKYTMHTNEYPTKFKPLQLASESWTGPNSPGKQFTIHAIQENQSLNKMEQLESLQLTKQITQSLRNLEFKHPTKVQSQAIPFILQDLNVMFVAETGSGKTYSYLLPICNKLITSKNYCSTPGSPFAVILVPTKELSFQVETMAQKLNLPIEIKSFDKRKNLNEFERGKAVDIVVTTPIKFLHSTKSCGLSLNKLQCMVVDECDTLLDESFSEIIRDILSRINIVDGMANPLPETQEAQLVLCSATFPPYADEALNEIIDLDDITSLQTGYTHRLQPHIEQKFLKVKPTEKLSTLVTILNKNEVQSNATIVFCNNVKTCDEVAQDLMQHGINVIVINKRIKNRALAINGFYSGETNVLVTTDILSRGINTPMVRHVINYDFPNAMSDYIHRSGRCGRVDHDAVGKVTNLISRKWEVPKVMKVEEAARKRDRLQGVSANIKGYLKERSKENKIQKYVDKEKIKYKT